MKDNLLEIGCFEEQYDSTYIRPYWVWIDKSNPSAPIAVAKGRGWDGAGCNLTPEEITSGTWQGHLKKCGYSNLVNIVKDLMAMNAAVTPEAIEEKWLAQ